MARSEAKETPWGLYVSWAVIAMAVLWFVHPHPGSRDWGVPLTTWYWMLVAWAEAVLGALFGALVGWFLLQAGLAAVTWVCLGVVQWAEILSNLMTSTSPDKDSQLTELIRSRVPDWWHQGWVRPPPQAEHLRVILTDALFDLGASYRVKDVERLGAWDRVALVPIEDPEAVVFLTLSDDFCRLICRGPYDSARVLVREELQAMLRDRAGRA